MAMRGVLDAAIERQEAGPAPRRTAMERNPMSTNFTDLLYTEEKGVATITINRPKVLNAFRAHTVEELIQAFLKAGWNKQIGVIVLTGIGDRAFSTGGDQSAHDGNYDGRGTNGMPIEELQSLIRDVPKPVIARVPGYAIGGGNVLATICDLTIASDKAIFGQVGPRMGSVDPGFGTAYLARVVGEKKAREIWYMCRRYSAQEALQMGLCNVVVPHDQSKASIAAVNAMAAAATATCQATGAAPAGYFPIGDAPIVGPKQ